MTKKHVLIAYALAVGLAVTYVPWNTYIPGRMTRSEGYAWIWVGWGNFGIVDFGRVILELIGLSIAAAVAYRLAEPDAPRE